MALSFLLRVCLLLVFCGIPVRKALAQDGLVRLERSDTTAVQTRFRYLVDPERKFTVDDVRKADQEGRFQSANELTVKGSYTRAVYWVKIVVENRSERKDWSLASIYPHIRFETFRVLDQEIRPLSPSKYRIPSVPLNLDPGQQSVLYLRVTGHMMSLPFQFVPADDLYWQEREATIFYSIGAGVFLAMIVYNLFLFLSLRDRNYLYYLFFAVVNSHLALLAVAFPPDIVSWGGIPWMTILPSYRCLAPLTTFLFVSSFLQTKTDYPRIHKAFLVYCAGLLFLMASPIFLAVETVMGIEDAYFFVGLLILIFAGIYSLNKGFRPSTYYLAGLGTFLVGMFIYLLELEGIVPRHPLTINSLVIGQAGEMLLMSLALGGKIKNLQIERASAQATAQVKSRLLRVISHDLATPLTVMKSAISQIRREKTPVPRLDQIDRSVGIVEEIMRFIIKSENLAVGEKMPLDPVRLTTLFESLAFLFEGRATEKGLRLTFELDPPDLTVLAEKTSLCNEVLGNLISNAIKFSFPGSDIRVRGYLEGKEVVVEVRDTGVGMTTHTLKGLFDPSKNRSARGTEGERGTGYGMPLCKAFVDSYKARIEVISRSMEDHPQDHGTVSRIFFTKI